MSFRYFLISLLCLAVGACSFKKPSAETPEEKAATEVIKNIEQQKFDGQLSDKNVSVKFVEKDEPGLYEVVATWPYDIPSMKVSKDGLPFQIISDKKEFRATLYHSSEISIHFVALNSIGGEISTYFYQGRSPSDLIVKKGLQLTQDTLFQVNRVYFLEDGKLITNGYNLSMYANKLYADQTVDLKLNDKMAVGSEAHIFTFAPGTIASGPEFLKGSKILIKVAKATGLLRVAMIGVDGKNGENGKDGLRDASLDGISGQDGSMVKVMDSCTKPNGLPCRSAPKQECEINPTNGTDGKNGYAGGKGEDGWNGGDSGTLMVFVNDHSEFKLETMLRRGNPGKGGQGGLGSEGGRGGAAGKNPGLCRNASPGRDGARGDNGLPGNDGKPGLIDQPQTNTPNALIYEVR